MNPILEKYLEAIGVDDAIHLTEEEKATFNMWKETLEGEVTIKTMSEWLKEEIELANRQIRKHVEAGENREALYQASRIDVMESLLGMIQSTKEAKSELEETIKGLIREKEDTNVINS